MSDVMLLGVLRMPMPEEPDPLTLRQFVDRARQAADRIEADAAKLDRMDDELRNERDQRRVCCCAGMAAKQPLVDRLEVALGAYWDAAYAEGRDGRTHDTEASSAQTALLQVRSAVATLVAAERERCAKLCEEVETQAWALWKTTADPTAQGRNIGAQHCADALRRRTRSARIAG